LTLFKQQFEHINFELRWFRQLDFVRRGRSGYGFADPNPGPLAQRHNLRDSQFMRVGLFLKDDNRRIAVNPRQS